MAFAATATDVNKMLIKLDRTPRKASV